jgi:hypothetical protein
MLIKITIRIVHDWFDRCNAAVGVEDDDTQSLVSIDGEEKRVRPRILPEQAWKPQTRRPVRKLSKAGKDANQRYDSRDKQDHKPNDSKAMDKHRSGRKKSSGILNGIITGFGALHSMLGSRKSKNSKLRRVLISFNDASQPRRMSVTQEYQKHMPTELYSPPAWTHGVRRPTNSDVKSSTDNNINSMSLTASEMRRFAGEKNQGLTTENSSSTISLLSSRSSAINIGSLMEKPRSPQKRPPSPRSEVSKGSFRPKSPKPIRWSAAKLPNRGLSFSKEKYDSKPNQQPNEGYERTNERSNPYLGNSDPFAEPRACRRAERLGDNKFLPGFQDDQARAPEKLRKKDPREQAGTRIEKDEPMSEGLLYRNMLRAQRKEAAAERYHKDERERLWRKQEA